MDVVMPPIPPGPPLRCCLTGGLGRHHNIHPKHPNHSLIVVQKKVKQNDVTDIESNPGPSPPPLPAVPLHQSPQSNRYNFLKYINDT